jgi:hypothetical protein
MKDKERAIIKIVSEYNLFDNPIKEYPKKMSRFDAYNKDCIVEIKHRENVQIFWDKPVIEFSKYSYNKEFAKLHKVNFLYLNRVKNSLAVFDILYLESINYDFGWEWKWMPETTEFGKTEKVEKYCGYINVGDACEIIQIV